MSFYVERIIVKNRAPFVEDIDLHFTNGSINILTAINGKGKTTLLSYIMDAWVEMTRDVFRNSYEDRPTKYYRISSSLFDLDNRKPSCVFIRFKYNATSIDYVDIRNNCSEEEYKNLVPSDCQVSYQSIKDNVERNGNEKKLSTNDTKLMKSIWRENIATYFPSYRHILPSYLNNCYRQDIEYSTHSSFSDELPNPLEVKYDVSKIVNWLMDVTVDAELYKKYEDTPYGRKEITPENILWDNVRRIIRSALISKYPDGNVRLAITKRASKANRVSVTNNKGDITYCPTIYNLSSGELEVLSIFAEILRQGDKLSNNILLNNITGIVLIDEIDMHLHIRLQKQELPSLLTLFPNVQFIVSSHSPFLNMGLSKIAKERTTIIDLDNGGFYSSPESTQQYEEVYGQLIQEKKSISDAYKKLKAEFARSTKPLVITEGKTDIKHILKAIKVLNIEQKFEVLPLDKQPDGWSNVKNLIENVIKSEVIGQPRKIIAIFDRDEPKLLNAYPDPYVALGNNVYGLCIPCPQSRIEAGRTAISIEYMYSDEELHSILPNGTHLFFGNEFLTDSTRRHKTDSSLRANEKSGLGIDKIIENNGCQAVYDIEFKNHLAKKDDFANAVVNDDICISNESWENFRRLIDIINEIIDK